ncbi:initiation factor 2B [Candidatus Gracilibacteria bacterium]|nr:initiation factor 2B [Candidatus Gracilibacteria bacterium]
MEQALLEALTALASDSHSGAMEIAAQGADLITRRARTSAAQDSDALRQELLDIGWGLIRAHPTMAPLVNLVNNVLWKVERVATPPMMQRSAAEAAQEFKRQLHVHEAAIAERALALIPEGGRVLTNGRSTTVRAALRYAQRAGRRFKVVCAESRPACEGRELAAELAESGIATVLLTDARATASIAEVQVVLVGADHLTHLQLVNKAGTYGLALACAAAEVPIYALCSSEKFLPPRVSAATAGAVAGRASLGGSAPWCDDR